MAYAKLDDRYDDHRKVRRALRREPAAIALHAMAITYCNRHETDGLIDVEQIEEWVALMPYKAAQKQKVLDTALSLGLFDRADEDHYEVHDFLDWNDSREHREALREAGRKGADARWGRGRGRGRGKANGEANADRNTDGIGDTNATADGPPHHTTPTPVPADAGTSPGEPADEPPAEFSEDVIRLCELHSQLVRQRTEEPEQSRRHLPTKAWHIEMDRLIRLDGRTPEKIERAIRWVHADPFWSKNILSVPKLRERYGQLVAAATRQAAPRSERQGRDEARRARAAAAGLTRLMQPTDDDFIEGSVVDDAA